MTTQQKISRILILIPAFALLILLIQENYSWIFGIMIGSAIALSSCELIQKAVTNVFVQKRSRSAMYYLFGFTFRFLIYAALLYAAIALFHVNAIALIVSFTFLQLLYPFYIVHTLENLEQNG